jgi:hypothetical protein
VWGRRQSAATARRRASNAFERWDGFSWQVEPSPDVGPKNNILVGISRT